jgi:hypothetical protein
VPALGRGDLPLRRPPHRPADGAPGGLRARLRGDAAALADELRARPGAPGRPGLRRALRRPWRMYLCYCEAGFAERRIGVAQAVLAKPRWTPREAQRQRGSSRRAGSAP